MTRNTTRQVQCRGNIPPLVRKAVEGFNRSARSLDHDLRPGLGESRQCLVEDLDPPEVAGAEHHDLGRRSQHLFKILWGIDVPSRLAPPRTFHFVTEKDHVP
jgi:hypothetical protein